MGRQNHHENLGEIQEYDPTHGHKKYFDKEYKNEYARYKPALVNR